MKVKIIKNSDKEYADCPKDNTSYALPYCRKNCKFFNGYKTLNNEQRTILCKHRK